MKTDLAVSDIFKLKDEASFNSAALSVFEYQRKHVKIYGKFVDLLLKEKDVIEHYTQIPFLPITLFREHVITDQPETPRRFFASSGTTGMLRSRHYLHDINLYDQSILKGFEAFFGDPSEYTFLALLPSYLEQGDSSLVYMMDLLIRKGAGTESGFYLHNHVQLRSEIESLKNKGRKIFLIGVTYALLDFYENNTYNDRELIIVETGGMKGRRKEMIREEVHEMLSKTSGASRIYSEYGMTELLSQAWSSGNGIFETPPWMKVLISDVHDPAAILGNGQTGRIKVIDLANIHSCSFIATQDLGRTVMENKFTVLGRMDSSEWRGCNLMVV